MAFTETIFPFDLRAANDESGGTPAAQTEFDFFEDQVVLVTNNLSSHVYVYMYVYVYLYLYMYQVPGKKYPDYAPRRVTGKPGR